MKQQKKIKKINKIRNHNLSKKSNQFWVKFRPSFFDSFPNWTPQFWKQRYRSEKALQEGLKCLIRKGHKIIETSIDKGETNGDN